MNKRLMAFYWLVYRMKVTGMHIRKEPDFSYAMIMIRDNDTFSLTVSLSDALAFICE